MKKWISILLALALCLPFSACGQEASSAPESGPSDRGNGAGPLSEEEAAVLRDTGTLQADPLTGYDYSDATGIWYYSNYPNYKDFNADGKIKVAFVCKFSGSWFTPTLLEKPSRTPDMSICSSTQTPTSRHGWTACRTSSTRSLISLC